MSKNNLFSGVKVWKELYNILTIVFISLFGGYLSKTPLLYGKQLQISLQRKDLSSL